MAADNIKTLNKNISELRDFVIDELKVCAEKLRDAGLEVEAQALDDKCESYNKGLFQAAFTGQFNAGKSTTINAIMHQKLLYVNINPATPVVTIIHNGEDSDIATVVYRDEKRDPEPMSLEEFDKRFRLNFKENEDKFKDVREVHLQRKLPTSSVAFVDTPGLGHTKTDDYIAREYLPKADVIVFMMHATVALTDQENKFIRENFARRQMHNIFFIVNWYNMVPPMNANALNERIRDSLYDVFVDINGDFDEELYSKRVFYVDSFTSECARTGNPKFIRKGAKVEEVKVPPEDDKYSGIPEFEEAFIEFLNSSEDLPRRSYSGYLPTVCGFYRNLRKHITDYESKMKLSLDELKEKEKERKEEIDKLDKIISRIKRYFDDALDSIMSQFGTTYDSFIASVENHWDDYFKKTPIDFGAIDEAKLLGLKAKYKLSDAVHAIRNFVTGKSTSEVEQIAKKLERDTETQKIMAPVQNAIKKYLEQEKVQMRSKFIANCTEPVKRLTENIELECKDMEKIDLEGLGIEQIVKNILAEQGYASNVKSGFNDVSMPQLLVSAMFGNVDQVLTGVANGKQDWFGFLIDLLATESFEWGLAFAIVLLVGPVGWLYYAVRIIFGIFSIRKKGKTMGQDMALQSKSVLVQELRNKRDDVISHMEDHMDSTLGQNSEKVSRQFQNQLGQQKNLFRLLVEDRKKTDNERQKRLSSLEEDLTSVGASISKLSEKLQGKKYTEQDIISYAVRTAIK